MFSPEFMKFLVGYSAMNSHSSENSNEQSDGESDNIINFRYAKLATTPIGLKKLS